MKQFQFISVLFTTIVLFGGGCFSTNDQPTQIAFDYIPGEIFVRMEIGHTRQDLEEITENFEVSIIRELGNGYIVAVPENFEPLWITQFSSVPIIDEVGYNRFGYNFTISTEEPGPIVDDENLILTVNYSGCEGGHAFTLERPGNFTNNMVIWLFKSTEDEDCEAYFSEELTFNLERFILLSTNVTIEDPYGNHVVLWPILEEPVED